MIIFLDETGSTNDYVKEHRGEFRNLDGAAAFNQTAGRGRLGRKWISPPGRNIAASFLVEDVVEGYHAAAMVGLAALGTVRKISGIDCHFKWPNDIYVGTAKLAGILSEGIIEDGRLAAVVCGIGLNVNSTRDDLAESGDPATSMLLETGRSFDIREVANIIGEKLVGYHARYVSSKEDVIAEWKRENRLIGTAVTTIDPCGAEIRGMFADIAPDGSMVLETVDGTRRFFCGDVKLPADGGNR